MRVISGKVRGHKLNAPEGLDVRPTLDRVKEAVFSSLFPYIDEAMVLDLFSGTGALGIEALSRGACFCDFVDASRASLVCTEKNIKDVGFEKCSSVHLSDWKSYIASCDKKYNLIFLDPPYSKDIENEVMQTISKNLSDDGIIVLETEHIPPEFELFDIKKQSKYGRVFITFYNKKADL